MPPHPDHETLKALLLENQRVLMENNRYLKKIHQSMVWGFWLRMLSWVIILGLPLLAYYYFLEPYTSVLAESIPTLTESANELNELRSWYDEWQAGRAQ